MKTLLVDHLAQNGLGYMTVDGAAGEKDNTSDFTVIQMWFTQYDETIALVDAVRDRLDPRARVEAVMAMHQKWGKYRFQNCRWESYGMDSDIFWLKEEQVRTSNHFPVVTMTGKGVKDAKRKRITGRVFPAFRGGRILLPETLMIKCGYLGGGEVDYVQVFRQQCLAYPLVENDDDLDCASRMFEPDHPLMYPNRKMARNKRDPYTVEEDGPAPDPFAPWA